MSQPCSGEHPGEGDGVVGVEAARAPSRWRRSARTSACPPATPRGRRRTPRAGTAPGRRASRRTRRRARWSAATGTTTAGSRGPVELEQVEPGVDRAARGGARTGPGPRPCRRGSSRAGTWLRGAYGQRRRRDHRPVAVVQRLVDPLPHQLRRALAPRVAELGADRAVRRARARSRRSASTPRRARRDTCPRTRA